MFVTVRPQVFRPNEATAYCTRGFLSVRVALGARLCAWAARKLQGGAAWRMQMALVCRMGFAHSVDIRIATRRAQLQPRGRCIACSLLPRYDAPAPETHSSAQPTARPPLRTIRLPFLSAVGSTERSPPALHGTLAASNAGALQGRERQSRRQLWSQLCTGTAVVVVVNKLYFRQKSATPPMQHTRAPSRPGAARVIRSQSRIASFAASLRLRKRRTSARTTPPPHRRSPSRPD